VLPVTAMIGGVPAQVVSYGGIPGVVAGVMQLSVQVPTGIKSGAVPATVQVGPFSSQSGVTIAVK
jgi:uncharacterized protein (TIGR03437 family)